MLQNARVNGNMSRLLQKIRFQNTSKHPELHWAEGEEFFVPKDTQDDLRLLYAYTPKKPLSSRLPFSYQNVPPAIRTLIAKAIGGKQSKKYLSSDIFPKWPLDLSADFLADLEKLPTIQFKNKTPLLITHDLDSAEGLRNLVEKFLPLERRFGVRSTNYIVPCGWKIDYALLDEVKAQGHEIGIHGFDHSNKTPFASPEERKKRLEAAKPLIEKYEIKGYRAPSLVRTKELLSDLTNYYVYDSSIPTSGGIFPVPQNGCATARPFKINNLWEIPVSLPRDGSLLFLGYSAPDILEIWKNCASKISASNGLITLLMHCENRFSGRLHIFKIYEKFLEWAASQNRLVFKKAFECLPN